MPMPTFALLSIRIASTPPSVKAMVSAAGKWMPVLLSPDGAIAGAAAVPEMTAKAPVSVPPVWRR